MKRTGLYITGSFLLMTLSAAAETWFSSASEGYSVFFPSIDLLKILFPVAIDMLETVTQKYSPLVWEVLISTVFQLPLWFIFAVLASIFSYILMTDASESEISGGNSKIFDIWTTITPYERENDSKLGSLINRQIKDAVKKPTHGDPKIWDPSLSLEGDISETVSKRPISSYEIPDFKLSHEDTVIKLDDETNIWKIEFESKKSIYVDPELWSPEPSSPKERSDFEEKNDLYSEEKLEIDDLVYEFDTLNEFLNYSDVEPDDDEAFERS